MSSDTMAFCTLPDLLRLLRRASWRILIGAILGALIMTLFGLIEPLKYTLQGSFREKNSSRSGFSAAQSSLTAMLLNSATDGSDSSAISTLKSRRMMENLIKAEGLQGVIENHNSYTSNWQRIRQNLNVEYARWTNRRSPVIPDPTPLLHFSAVVYAHEVPLGLLITFDDENNFRVMRPSGELLGKGSLNTPFANEDYSFTLTRRPFGKLTDESFDITLLPFSFTAHDFTKQFNVAHDLEDKSLLILKLRYPDRKRGTELINTLMRLYQEHLQAEHQLLIAEQLGYLQNRQGEVNDRLKAMMFTYAENLSQDFTLLGFIDTQKAMEFLSNLQYSIKNKLFTIDMEIKRLKQARVDGKFYLDTLTGTDISFLNKLLLQIRDLQQQHDSMQVALNRSSVPSVENMQDLFELQIEELTQLQKAQKAIIALIKSLEAGEIPRDLPEALTPPHYMVTTWHTKLLALTEQGDNTVEWQEAKGRYLTYLRNLLHHIQVHTTAIEENLAHQQNPIPELQGINLNIAQELFLTYSKDANNLEGKILQHEFVIEQIQQPHFEISSLSAIIDDPVSQEVVTDAMKLVLAIKDQSNRSHREVDRLEEELRLQRIFLAMHLTQAKDLLKLRFQLFHSKLRSVQHATLALLQQHISVAQNQLEDYILLRIDNLLQEYALLIKQQDDLQTQMALLPHKWVEEQLIYQQMDLNRQMGREITNLVESKNISSNLEIVQSAPVDLAIAPLHPPSPRAILLFWLGAAGGTIFMIAWTLLGMLRRGLPASADNLRLTGVTVAPAEAGARYLATLLKESDKLQMPQSVLVTSLPYVRDFAITLVKQGDSVAVVPLEDKTVETSNDSDLVICLKRREGFPTLLRQAEGYDLVSSSGLGADGIDLAQTAHFRAILARLQSEHDWVIVSSNMEADNLALLSLLNLFDRAIIATHGELLPYLHEVINRAKSSPEGSIIFVPCA